MFYNGFLKVAAVTPELIVGNPRYNVEEMLRCLDGSRASICLFPELGVTGYTCADYFYQSALLGDCYDAIEYFLAENRFGGIVLLGAPLEVDGSLYNCGFVIQKNRILGIVPKMSIPNAHEFYEKRWFASGRNTRRKSVWFRGAEYPFGNLLFADREHDLVFGVEICEDMWAPISPSNFMACHGANVIFNLSGSNETLGKSQIRRTTVMEMSRRNCGAYVYVSAGVSESTSETVFSGHNVIAQCGKLLVETENFCQTSELIYGDLDLGQINFARRSNTNLHDGLGLEAEFQQISINLPQSDSYQFEKAIDQTPFIPKENPEEDAKKVASLQEYALYKRLKHTGAKSLVIGVSGGLDSTLALLIAVEAFRHLGKDLKDIISVTMPGMATTDRTRNNAWKMMEALGVCTMEKPIGEECDLHFAAIGQDPTVHDITYENTQARIRTLILMNLANKHNGIVLGTGDMSELALGWCTYNGDQMSMYGINCGIPKTLVRFMIRHYADTKFGFIRDILLDIIDMPITPELSDKDQRTEDAIGKYEINDFILHRYLSCGDSRQRITWLLQQTFGEDAETAREQTENFFRRFFAMQFKRQALPDGPKILDIALSPRSDYRMPSDLRP